jgi:fructan beta-fructosidase
MNFNKAGLVLDATRINPLPLKLSMQTKQLASYTITLSNDLGESVQFGYDQTNHQYFVDRSKAGVSSFHKEFAAKHTAPRIAQGQTSNLEVIIDKTSIELFADDGLSVMTDIFFPSVAFHKMTIQTEDSVLKKSFQMSYWRP